jgi:hypothetical protein
LRQTDTNTDQKRRRSLQGIVLDVDGTLLDPGREITPATHAAVARARDAGLRVLLASGRSARSLRPLLEGLGLRGPAIAFNGALTFELTAQGGIRVLDGTTVAPADAAAVLARASELRVEVGWYELDGWLAARSGPGVRLEADATDEEPTIHPELPHGAPRPYKLMCIALSARGREALHVLRERLPPELHAQFSDPRFLEVTAAGIGKEHALAAACARLGLQPAALAALGDAENDIGMLRAVGVGIAMGNAAPAVRAAADRVTETNGRDGVALAIDALLDAPDHYGLQ